MDGAVAAFDAFYARADGVIKPAVFSTLDKLGWHLTPTPVTKGLPFVDSPTGLLLCLAAYFVIVVFGVAVQAGRPAVAADSKRTDPAWLRAIVLLHNLFLVGLSLFMSGGVAYYAYEGSYSLWGNAYKPNEKGMAAMIYIFFVSKIYEFMDTFIMLLKGNLQQVSVLHVYHHASISFIWWMITYTAPGGDAYFSAALNSFVHVLMYTYYLLAILLGKDPKTRSRYLWWGRYLTQFQMAQFMANLAQAWYCQRNSPYPRFLSELLLWYMLSLLALFGSFYYRKHVRPSASKPATRSTKKRA